MAMTGNVYRITAIAGKNPRLLLHALVIRVHFALTITTAGTHPITDGYLSAHIHLFGAVLHDILQTFYLHRFRLHADALSHHLCSLQAKRTATFYRRQAVLRTNMAITPCQVVPVGITFSIVGATGHPK